MLKKSDEAQAASPGSTMARPEDVGAHIVKLAVEMEQAAARRACMRLTSSQSRSLLLDVCAACDDTQNPDQ